MSNGGEKRDEKKSVLSTVRRADIDRSSEDENVKTCTPVSCLLEATTDILACNNNSDGERKKKMDNVEELLPTKQPVISSESAAHQETTCSMKKPQEKEQSEHKQTDSEKAESKNIFSEIKETKKMENKPAAKRTGKKKSKKKSSSEKQEPVSAKITDFFPVRRSSRKTAAEIKREKHSALEAAVLAEEEGGLDIKLSPTKGRGIVASQCFKRGDFVVEYRGDLISRDSAIKRNEEYSKNEEIGSYMYYFCHKGKSYCVDATRETPYLGRLVNHSAKRPNLVTKVVDAKGSPHLILVAARDINIGEELLYDYGERKKDAVALNPWLKDT